MLASDRTDPFRFFALMKGFRLFGFLRLVGLCFGLLSASCLFAGAEPEWELVVVESDKALFEGQQLHAKEGEAWLLTVRMRVKSLKLIPPISKLEFAGKVVTESEEDVDEVVWTKSHTIRRKDFEAAYGGGRSQFVRVYLRGIPPEVNAVEMSYLKEEESE